MDGVTLEATKSLFHRFAAPPSAERKHEIKGLSMIGWEG